MKLFERVQYFMARLMLGVLLGGLASVCLVQWAPGFGVDERELDPTLSDSTRRRIRDQNKSVSFWKTYARQVAHAVHGDFGVSSNFNAPVADLIADRALITAKSVAFGLAIAWGLAVPAAAMSVVWRGAAIPLMAAVSILLCIPLGLVAVYFFLLGFSATGVIAAGVIPKVFGYLRELLTESAALPHVLAAAARGVHPWRIFWQHRFLAVAPETLSLAAVSINIALGAAIPAEALCDSPGLGQLAWKAATARDLAPLLAVTWLLTTVTLAANSLATVVSGTERTWRP